MYTYKDIATGRIKRTKGSFVHWTERMGPLGVKYAVFRNPKGAILVPIYALTPETREQLPTPLTSVQESKAAEELYQKMENLIKG